MIHDLLLFAVLGMALAWPSWRLLRWLRRSVLGLRPQGPLRWVTPYVPPAQRAIDTDRTSA